jgi:DNA-binding helix-turn-helix protein|nr:MAG TPA: Helix-turn-helix XRE-family like protein [Caudoviricetes sp.]
MFLGDKIRKMRLEKGMTQKELAGLIGCTGPHITHVEKRQRDTINLNTACRIANVFEISIDELVEGTEFDLTGEEEE